MTVLRLPGFSPVMQVDLLPQVIPDVRLTVCFNFVFNSSQVMRFLSFTELLRVRGTSLMFRQAATESHTVDLAQEQTHAYTLQVILCMNDYAS